VGECYHNANPPLASGVPFTLGASQWGSSRQSTASIAPREILFSLGASQFLHALMSHPLLKDEKEKKLFQEAEEWFPKKESDQLFPLSISA
jgi:hypothetical protein